MKFPLILGALLLLGCAVAYAMRVNQNHDITHADHPLGEDIFQEESIFDQGGPQAELSDQASVSIIYSMSAHLDDQVAVITSDQDQSPIQAGSPLNLVLMLSAVANFLARFIRRTGHLNQEFVIPAMTIVCIIHDALKSSGTKKITDLIPGDWDDKLIRSWLNSLESVIRSYNVIKEGKEKISQSELFDQFLAWLNAQPEVVRKAMYLKTASTLVKNRAKIKENESDLLVQAQYTAAKAA